MTINYAEMFEALHPGFFEDDGIRSLPPAFVFDEQILDLHKFCEDAVQVNCPEHIAFGFYKGDAAALHTAVREVDEDWVQYFNPNDRVFCAFDAEKVVSFCILDEFGQYAGMKIGGPGCVGTLPAWRKQGIGLKLVQKATAILKAEGFDLSWIHYTHVGHWYARLGYKTVIRWNAQGIVEQEA